MENNKNSKSSEAGAPSNGMENEIQPQKRNDYLLLIVGAGAEKNNLQNKVKSLGLENNIK